LILICKLKDFPLPSRSSRFSSNVSSGQSSKEGEGFSENFKEKIKRILDHVLSILYYLIIKPQANVLNYQDITQTVIFLSNSH